MQSNLPFLQSFDLSSLLNSYNLRIVLLLAVGFALASLFGYFAWRLKLSPILGYLLAGYLIGPYSPGFVADIDISEQLAEIGVILMMFGVGLDFKLKDLINVRKIAIPGAIGQTLICALFSMLILYFFGWELKTGLFVGLAIGVASTVVLARMLDESRLLKTQEGHIAVGWLIVEDIITVLILLLLPNVANMFEGSAFSLRTLLVDMTLLFVKFLFLALILFTFGRKSATYLLTKVTSTRSHELFTLTILAIVFVIAIGTTFFFGISIALGAFIAGMIVRQTKIHHKVLIHSLAMKDAFIAIFFLSVGMLFDPSIIIKKFFIFLTVLLIILLIKPITAFLISKFLKYPFKTSLIVAASLAQIGEFSFILSEESMRYGFMPDDAYDVIVASALISIAINPLLFKFFHKNRPSSLDGQNS